jgi:hypothetical protein
LAKVLPGEIRSPSGVSHRIKRRALDLLDLAMFTGRKQATSDQGIPAAWVGLGVVMVAAVMWFWWSQR